MLRLEFLIEPFEEGRPGPHVRAAIDAVTSVGHEVEFGPFSSTCDAESADMPRIVAAMLAAAFDKGATHVRMSVDAIDTVDDEPGDESGPPVEGPA